MGGSEAEAPMPPDARLAGGIRASDAERDAVAGRLRDEYVAGRLSHDTFLHRMDAVLAARQQADLSPLLTDLPEPPRRAAAAVPRLRGLVSRLRGTWSQLTGELGAAVGEAARDTTRQSGRGLTMGMRGVGGRYRPFPLQFPRGGGPRFSIGRDASCDLAIADMSVSRRHAALERAENGWLLTDLESTNGTRVNGWRVLGPVPVHPGDLVSFGNIEYVMEAVLLARGRPGSRGRLNAWHVLKSGGVTTVLLVRHGLTATTGQLLTGWTPGVGLDDRGLAQAKALGDRLAAVPLTAIVTSPLDRCQQTVAEIIAARGTAAAPEPVVDERVGECRYGDWTGKPLGELAKDPLWPVVQAHPSAVRFPGPAGESMLDMQHRAVTAIREWNGKLGSDATYLVCSHGDVIKAIVADSLGLHLDQCQRIVADPCSLTVIRYTQLRPFLLRLNDTGGSADDLLPRPAPSGAASSESDAVIGGGAGSSNEIGTQGDAPRYSPAADPQATIGEADAAHGTEG